MRPIRLLIVDDSAAVRDGLQSILSAHEDLCVAGSASNGAEALERLSELAPDVVLMDAQMPVMDGIECTRELKKIGVRPRVIFLSVHPSYLKAALDAGADAALLKDVDRKELVERIRRLAAS